MALPLVAALPSLFAGLKGIITTLGGDKQKRDEAEASMRLLLANQFESLEATYRAELETQKAIIVAELQQGDKYTKRARPSVIYAGLAVAVFNGILPNLAVALAAALGNDAPTFQAVVLPAEFWWAWSGVAGAWVIGRTRERVGAQPGAILSAIYGAKDPEK